MPSTYSSLKIQLMATGENATTWGTITNTNLGTALEEAIVGSADVTFASANVTLTLTDSNASQTARNLRLRCTGTTAGARDLIVPAIEKVYIVRNDCADTITVKNATGTGIAVPAGASTWVYNDGTNVVNVVTYLASATLASPVLITPTLGVASATSIANGLGAVGTPSYTFTGDLNTGIWSPAADTIAFSEGGVESMRLNSSGNVGIGTTTIDSRLHVANSTTTNAVALFDGSNAANVLQSISVRNIAASGTGVPSISMSQWRTSFAGNLDVGQLRFDGLTTTGVYNEFAAIYATAGTNTATGAPTALVFRTQNASFVAAERMRITPAGDVGIGNTPSGTYKLEVTGALFASSAVLGAALPVGSGGTGATTLTGVVIGTGTTAFTVKANPSGAFVGDTDTQNLTNKTLTTGNTLNAGTTVSDTGTIAATSPGFRGVPQNTRTGAYTLLLTDAGKHVYSNSAVTINASIFSAGDSFVIVNSNTATTSINITAGAGVTLRLAGTTTAGTPRPVAPNGMASVLCVVGGASPVFLVSGAGVS